MKNTSDPASRFAAPFCTALAVVAFACSSKPPATTAAVTPPPTVPGAAGMQAPVVPTMPNVPVAGGPSMGVAGAQAAAAGTGAPSVPMNPGTMPMNPGSMPMNPGGMPTVPVNPGETPQPSASHDWRMMGYDLGSTYFNKAETKLTKQNAAMLASKWTAELSSDINGTPLIVGDKVYAGDGSTTRAYALADGKESWKAMVGSSSSLAYDDGTLYLNENAGKIVAMNAATGTIKWMKPADKQTADGSSSVLIAGELILIGGSNGNNELGGGAFRGYMSALDKLTGDIVWTTYTVPENGRGASMWSSPAADLEAMVAYGSTGNNYSSPATDTSDAIIQFDLKTGTIKWKNQRVMNDVFPGLGPDADFGANPVLYETMIDGAMVKVVAAGNKGGKAHAIRRDDGMLLWERSLGGGAADGSRGVFTNSTWAGKNLIMACNEGSGATMYALDGATGNIAWMRRLSGLVWGRISVANGVGFVGAGSTLDVFDIETGASIKTFPSKGGTIASTIAVSNGHVAFGEGLTWSGGRPGRTLTVLAVP